MCVKQVWSKLLDCVRIYVVRVDRLIDQSKEDSICEVCYEGLKSNAYSCLRHQVCNDCFRRISVCPWCRCPKLGVYADLWYYESELLEWLPLTEDIVRHGFLANFIYDDYIERFDQIMQTAVMNLEMMQNANIPFKMLLHVIIDCVNLRTNFPIFVYQDKRNIHYCSKRWKLIEKHICLQLSNNPADTTRMANQLSQSLRKLLCKIKELAPEGSLKIVVKRS